MAAPTTTLWELEPHTRAKHEILRRYLQAWQAILTRGGFQELVYIDGFAGPGRYSGGEDGSPIIALRNALALARHQQKMEQLEYLFFLFVEKDPERARVLQQVIDGLERPGWIRVKVAAGKTFEEAFSEFIGFYERKRKRLPPTFAFIDPFGWKGAPLSIVKKIMSYPSCEVLVNFMYEEINRFIGHPDQEQNFDSFFGAGDWRQALAIQVPAERNRFLHDLYAKQLHQAAAVEHVRSFQMKNDRDVTDYYLFHATNSFKGLQKMKEAMWRVDESGGFTFSDATDPDQLVMFERTPRFDVLRRQVLAAFAGRQVTVADVENFVVAKTAFRETHYKSILKDLEEAEPPQLTAINPAPGRRRGTFPEPSMAIRFT